MPLMDLVGAKLSLTAPDEVPHARAAVRRLAAKVLSRPGDVDDVELMACEAITNALLHGSGAVTVAVSTRGDRLCVEVCDDGPNGRAASRADHRRGLLVIEALAAAYELTLGPPVTCLRFEVNVEALGAPQPALPVGGESEAGATPHPGLGFTQDAGA